MKMRTNNVKLWKLILPVLALLIAAPAIAQTTECEAGFRLFNHEVLATDPVCVPVNPQRVIALDPFTYELLILNSTPPVGAIGYLESVYRRNFSYLEDRLTGIENVGFPPNPEAILALDPDLIVGSYLSDEQVVQLTAIAPTISYTAFGSGDWKRPMALVGELLGLSELVDDLMAGYQARLDALNAAVENASEIEVSIVRITPDQIMLNLVNSFPAVIVTDAGFGRPESQAYSEEDAIATYGGAVGAFISLEQIDLVDGDYVFAWSNQASNDENADSDANWDAVQASPLWGTLTAAQNGTAYRVTGHWLGWGIFAAHGIVDDLFTYVAEVDPAQVSPNPFLTSAATEITAAVTVEGFPPYAAAPTMLEVIEDRGDTLVVRHLFGETEIPANPQRIYADGSTFDILLSLGVEPVAANTFYVDLLEPPSQLVPLIEDLTIYNRGPANPEVILSHQPDLILVWEVALWEGSDGIYDLLSAIAPTVVLQENPYSYWEQATVDIAIMLGLSEEAASLLEGYRAFVEEQCALIRSVIDEGETVTIIGVLPGQIYLIPPGYTTEAGFIPLSPTRWAYQDCQIEPGDEVIQITGPDGDYALLSDELIADLQADHLVVLQLASEGDALTRITESAIWQALPAVRQGSVYISPIPTNQSYYGALDTFEQFSAVFTGTDGN
jgi:iron complex transport system substrate-binding protein